MAAFVEANVPGAESFRTYASEDGTEGTVVYVHPNADSLDQHLAAAAALIDDGTKMVEVTSVELLGAPHSATVERLASVGTPVTTKRLVAGVSRR